MLQQIVEVVKSDGAKQTQTEERLNVSFTLSKQKHADHDKSAELLRQRVEMIMQTVNALSSTIASRLNQILEDIGNWKRGPSQNDA